MTDIKIGQRYAVRYPIFEDGYYHAVPVKRKWFWFYPSRVRLAGGKYSYQTIPVWRFMEEE